MEYTYGLAGEDQRKGASKMRSKDQCDGHPDDRAIDLMVCTSQQTQVTNQQSNLEETNTKLIEWSACKIDSCVRYQILLRSIGYRKAEAISCL